MRRELTDTFGIQVSLVLPGMVPSEIRSKVNNFYCIVNLFLKLQAASVTFYSHMSPYVSVTTLKAVRQQQNAGQATLWLQSLAPSACNF